MYESVNMSSLIRAQPTNLVNYPLNGFANTLRIPLRTNTYLQSLLMLVSYLPITLILSAAYSKLNVNFTF